jgi:RNA polymerase sigma factor (sigma-70 family)
LIPADSQSKPDNGAEADAVPDQTPRHVRWVLTTQALDKLLSHFSADRDEAGSQYEMMRIKLVRYFEFRKCASAEDLADETINRVARRMDEGENIFNLPAYFSSVARLVFMEWLRERERTAVPLDDIPERSSEQPFEDEEKEARFLCLDQCLDNLPPEKKTLMLTYFHQEKRARINLRKQLADGLDIPLNALRIRVHRIRIVVENCVRVCMAERGFGRNTTAY